MAMDIGGVLGTVANLRSAISKPKSLLSFLSAIDKMGIQVKNNFEINFSGLEEISFFATSIALPGMRTEFTEYKYDGKSIPIPVISDYDHEFSMTMLNDAQGIIYSTIKSFIFGDSSLVANSGFTLIVKALTGDSKYKGMHITLNGVRFASLSGLTFGHSDNDISTFELTGRCTTWSATPGALSNLGYLNGAIQGAVS